MSERTQVLISKGEAREPTLAILIDGVSRREAMAADTAWIPYLNAIIARAEAQNLPESEWPEHWHWKWAGKAARLSAEARHFGIECDGLMQGMMIALPASKRCRYHEQKDMPLVYVDYIAAAPWNLGKFLRRLGSQPEYPDVGRVLMTVAITLSRDLGYGGRIGLNSLPQTESFYSNTCGMLDLGLDRFSGSSGSFELRYYEMTPEIADIFTGKVEDESHNNP